MTHKVRATALGVLTAAAAAVVLASPAAATPKPVIPDDVSSYLSNKGIRQVQENLANFGAQAGSETLGPTPPDASGNLRAGRIHQVYLFTDAWVKGSADADPAEATQQWVAPVLRGNEAIGTVRVWKPDGGPAEVAGFNGDTQLADALQGFKDLPVVEDPSAGEFFALDGDSVLPINEASKRELPKRGKVKDLQPIVAERIAQGARDAAGVPDSVGGGGPSDQGSTSDAMSGGERAAMAGGLVLLVGGGAAAVAITRNRRQVRKAQES
ncbi:hypothetical protein [Kineococcus rhizosphaerae]|nr:hypothetical protein [Kineococcus rhizosphaerae]